MKLYFTDLLVTWILAINPRTPEEVSLFQNMSGGTLYLYISSRSVFDFILKTFLFWQAYRPVQWLLIN